MRTKKNKPAEYVNNEKFYLEMVRYKALVEQAKQKGLTKPPIPEYIGACILMIAQRLSNNKNFIGYSYKDEMISDGIENCILYLDNFDPDKTQNPFAYFTQIIWYAFIRRIQRERRQQYIKAKNLQRFALIEALNEEVSTEKMMPNDALNDLIESFEKNEKKKQKKPQGVEKFVEEDDE